MVLNIIFELSSPPMSEISRLKYYNAKKKKEKKVKSEGFFPLLSV